MLDRFLSGTVALDTSRPGLRLRDLDDPAINADPAGFPFAILASFLLGTVGVTTSCPAFLFGNLDYLSVHAAPNGLGLTMRSRFFFGSVTLQVPLPCFRFRKLRDFSIDADPAEFSTALATTALCVFLGVITLEFAGLCIGHAHLHNVAVDADPAEFSAAALAATSFGFLFGTVARKIPTTRFDLRHLRYSAIDARPAGLVGLAMVESILNRSIKRDALLLGVCLRC
jgi:hypothetical protein